MLGFRRRSNAPAPVLPAASISPGRRVYAVGDVHGRLDLLTQALQQVQADHAAVPAERAFIVFLGDLIDRGPASREVIEELRSRRWGELTPVFLLGNHEEAMLAAMAGDIDMLRQWVGFGGSETAQSYGVSPVLLLKEDWQGYFQALRAAVPAEHLEFLRGFYDQFALGDYLFVHAGVRPGVELDRQNPHDLRWIRDEFLCAPGAFDKVVVHGHTISDEPELLPHRIGIDTGAYKTGRLTVLRLEGEERRILSGSVMG